jgi:hypothetical protein
MVQGKKQPIEPDLVLDYVMVNYYKSTWAKFFNFCLERVQVIKTAIPITE